MASDRRHSRNDVKSANDSPAPTKLKGIVMQKRKEVYCECDDWKQSFPQISGAQSLAWVHGSRYTGAVFRFCPWCGKVLIEVLDGTEPQ